MLNKRTPKGYVEVFLSSLPMVRASKEFIDLIQLFSNITDADTAWEFIEYAANNIGYGSITGNAYEEDSAGITVFKRKNYQTSEYNSYKYYHKYKTNRDIGVKKKEVSISSDGSLSIYWPTNATTDTLGRRVLNPLIGIFLGSLEMIGCDVKKARTLKY